MIICEKRTKIISCRVQPELLIQVQDKIDKINANKKKYEKNITISDLLEDKLVNFLENVKM